MVQSGRTELRIATAMRRLGYPEEAITDVVTAVKDGRTQDKVDECPPGFMTISEAAAEFGVPVTTLRYWARQLDPQDKHRLYAPAAPHVVRRSAIEYLVQHRPRPGPKPAPT